MGLGVDSSKAIVLALLLSTGLVSAQIGTDTYERANQRRREFSGLAVGVPDPANAIPNTNRFWYRKSVKGGHEFILVDPETRSKRPAFDHARLAASLSAAAGGKYSAVTLPFSTVRFVDEGRGIEVAAGNGAWRCDLRDYACTRAAPAIRRWWICS